ncbi:MAG: SsrA-binding protein SmpB [Clostridia bacterium]
MKLIADNRKAFHEYFIEEKYEAGIVLKGSEVKSLRNGNCNLKDSYVIIKGDEMFVLNMHIATYEKTSTMVEDTRKTRKLLLNKSEILKLERKIKIKGYTIVPTKIYFSGNYVKMEIALAKGKQLFDKRDSLKDKDIERELDREKIRL